MLLLHQTGSVKVGEVVRYTLTYTPSHDRILPPPTQLHVKIKNTSAIPLRAAYLHGPYTVYVSCRPSTYSPHADFTAQAPTDGAPDFEPQLKAGGHWLAKLTVPEEVRGDADRKFFSAGKDAAGGGAEGEGGARKSMTWIIEVASQVLFSTTAAVHFEVLVGRDAKSVELGFHGVVGSGQGAPGRLEDHRAQHQQQSGGGGLAGEVNSALTRGVFSKAVRLVVQDTEGLWNSPPFPDGSREEKKKDEGQKRGKRKQKKVHLVLLTHGLHSNLGADMLYMKESIDAATQQAREKARERRARRRAERSAGGRAALDERAASAPEIVVSPTEKQREEDESDSDDEETLVRGFNGNAVKTEKGIQYLGKRFAKYVLLLTYPTQPYLPVKSSISKSITRSLTGSKLMGSEKTSQNGSGAGENDGKKPIHKNSTIMRDDKQASQKDELPYKITSISFIGHSLGGIIQTYAIAYIQKHSPEFFDLIQPVNFVALATPFLGLSNENPMYVKFALDFGLVGRTGQDLGLTWTPPTFAKNSWSTMISGLGVDSQKDKTEPDPGAKPLLRILPTGPAHVALKKFRHRTVYANVVNDGIVPLRTSCLLFLDWRGLGRVEKARRENGLVGTMLEWGWTEMMGQNASVPRKPVRFSDMFGDDDADAPKPGSQDSADSPDPGSSVPQADASQGFDDADKAEPERHQFLDSKPLHDEISRTNSNPKQSGAEQATTMWSGFLSLFRPQAGKQKAPPKSQRIYRRGQTMKQHIQGNNDEHNDESRTSTEEPNNNSHKPLVRGPSLYSSKSNDETAGGLQAPPKTTVFESAGDLLHPPLPPPDFILSPAARPRTIFHDRIYHPDDIPAPPAKKQRTFLRKPPSRESSISTSGNASGTPQRRPSSVNSETTTNTTTTPEVGAMRIEEKIARAYHKDLTWRKVLVRLEPDAHNNMIVRRMFANAYGWPVVAHMCDTHFGYTATAYRRDEELGDEERAKPLEREVEADGEKVEGQMEEPDDDDDKQTKRKSPPHATKKAATMNDVDDLQQMGDDIDKLREKLRKSEEHAKDDVGEQRQQTADAANKQSTGNATRTKRTPSEAREALDSVPDLNTGGVSRVHVPGTLSPTSGSSVGGGSSVVGGGGSGSGSSALRSLARKDSGRWSDRFLEDDEEDEDIDPSTLGGAPAAAVGKVLGEEGRLVGEPAQIDSERGGEGGVPERKEGEVERENVDLGVDPQVLGLTGVGVGLGKSVEERVGVPESPTTRKDEGVGGVEGVMEHVTKQANGGECR